MDNFLKEFFDDQKKIIEEIKSKFEKLRFNDEKFRKDHQLDK